MGSLQSETLQKESLRLHPTFMAADPHVDVRRKGAMMYDLKWLEGYSGQTTEELIDLEGEYRTDSLVLAFEQALDQKAARVGLEGLTEEERVVLAIETIEREVNNGGYGQLFTNSSEYTPLFVSALHDIGCPEVAELTEQAIAALGIEGPITTEAIDRVMKRMRNGKPDCQNMTASTLKSRATLQVPFLSSSRPKETRSA
jgi:hypothetical protein